MTDSDRNGKADGGGRGRAVAEWAAGWIGASTAGVAWTGLALAWAAGLARWAGTAGEWSGWDFAGLAAAWAWAGGIAWILMGLGRRWGDRRWVATAAGVSLAAGLAWAWATRGMGRWPMDSGYFRVFLDRLAEGGWRVETLAGLTGGYDYGAWTTRAWPVLYPLRLWAGAARFGLAAQVLQAVLGAAGVILAWRTAKLVCGDKAARWTGTLLASMPGWAMQSVGLNHQALGTFDFLAATWLLTEWTFGGGGWKKKTALCAVACAAATAARFESSVWSLHVLAGGFLLVVFAVCLKGRRLNAVCGLLAMLAVPALVSRLAAGAVLAPAREANPESVNGGSVAFLARGWDPQWGGEYSDTLQTLDILTPREEKSRFFEGYLAGQCAWNGKLLAGRLFPAKLAKFMLAGYASLAEEVLWANGAERVARAARGARVGWFLVWAPLALWGLWRVSGRAGCGDGRLAWVAGPVAAFAVAVVFAGETSPRYAMPVLPLLFATAAWGWAGEEDDDAGCRVRWAWFGTGLATVAVAYLGVAAAVLGGREFWKSLALKDMREAVLEGGSVSEAAERSPFEARFGNGAGSVAWPGPDGGAMAVYAWGASWRDRGKIEWRAGEGEEWRATQLPARLAPHWDAGPERRLEMRRVDGGTVLQAGYAVELESGGR
ncbi:MAG: hypothetical protein IK066_06870 [Kiritimatiellae bacterium]|nr:hypothetical protein [Kiritimatiellia bacterium]